MKYKQLIIGLIIGFIVASILPVGAAIQEYICYKADYRVMINDVEFVSPDLPILSYKGNTYAPIRPMLEAAGLNINWNAELGQAEITPKTIESEVDTMAGTAIQYDELTGLPVGAEYVENEKDGVKYKTIRYNDSIFISTADLKNIFRIKYVRMIENYTKSVFEKDGQQIIIDKIPNVSSFTVGAYVYENIEPFMNYLGE
jgi:hypothetical protein